jgi:hypothetical protein
MRSHLNINGAERLRWWCWRRTTANDVGGELPKIWLYVERRGLKRRENMAEREWVRKHDGRERVGKHGRKGRTGKQGKREHARKIAVLTARRRHGSADVSPSSRNNPLIHAQASVLMV